MKQRPALVLLTLLSLAGAGCAPAATYNAPPVSNTPSATTTAPAPSTDSGFVTHLGETNRLRVTSPAYGATVSRPLMISGENRGWYFEASFPIHILNKDGALIASGIAQAGSDWMSPDWVPFTARIDFPPQMAGSSGTIVFIKDNPSGDPAKDDYVLYPIHF